MSLLDRLSSADAWNNFFDYKTSLISRGARIKELRRYIDEKRYLPVYEKIKSGEPFPMPKKAVINKMSSKKSRTVYTYPYDESIALKLLTYLILRKYDGIFSAGLYSFRPGRNAKDAIKYLLSHKGINKKYAYKVDISNYFNSIPVERIMPMLREVFSDDVPLCEFLCGLLGEPYVIDRGEVITEQKGIMAGTPVSAFYANLYLRGLDELFGGDVIYMRYSDDVIVFADTRKETEHAAKTIRAYLRDAGLTVNPDKESFFTPDDGFCFLGFSYKNGICDIAPVTVDKLKGKMRRKTRALQRWYKRKGKSGENAAKAFIRIFNKKLLESPDDNELSWSYWFFSVINTAASLRMIDSYAQDCIRYLCTGTRTKARFNMRYDEMKLLGYKSLVHEFYAHGKRQKSLADAES